MPSGRIKELLLLHHSHTDIGYTHAQPIVWELHRRFIDQAMDFCEQTADWPEPSRLRWTCEVTGTLQHWVRHASSRQIDRFRRLVKTGQMGAGALFLNGTPLSSAEQLARSLQPVRELRESLGLPLTVAIAHDINGLPWPITQLLRDAGIEMLIMGINAYYGGFPAPRPRGFRWQGADGRELLVWNGSHYSIMSCTLVESMKSTKIVDSTDHVAATLARYLNHLNATDYPHDFAVMTATHPHQCDNNPPHLLLADVVRRWNEEGRTPAIRYVTPEGVLAKLKSQPAGELPVHSGDWTDYWNFGAASAARETKVNR
jgi:alpha-mannosidase